MIVLKPKEENGGPNAPQLELAHSAPKLHDLIEVRGRPAEANTERKVINTIIELRDDGMSYDKIASFLTKMGVSTKTRRRKWNGGCVRAIYIGHKALSEDLGRKR